ncbi:unnamed protein product [Caenorhabditis nigoni]|uniref:CCHC-type domain-containing protein n=1 Tax=Caenorhabditis nigoni TaxID=1611254 RepID=A0A2G5SFL6_9PELO|nr:hypothetical protein B9Z55_027549 [Caenorhabditis nigoni]
MVDRDTNPINSPSVPATTPDASLAELVHPAEGTSGKSHPTHPTNNKEAARIEQEDLMLETETCLGNLRAAAKLSTANVISLKDAVVTDLAGVHERMLELTKNAADRFEIVEERIQRAETRIKRAEDHILALKDKLPSLSRKFGSSLTFLDQAAQTIEPAPEAKLSELLPGTPRPAAVVSQSSVAPEDDEFATPVASRVRTKSVILNVLGSKIGPSLTPFTGTPGENFSTFIRSFNDQANAAKTPLDAAGKRAVFLTFLSDYARDKAQELIDTTTGEATFDEIVAHLKLTFQDPTRSELERQQLRSCSQRFDECVDAFCSRVRKLAQSAYLDKDRGYIEDKAKEAFVDGLLFNLRFHVKGDSPQTFQDAFNSAIKYEALLSEAAKANTIVPQGLSVVPATPPAMSHVRSQEPRPPRISDACYECGLEGHYAIDCRQRQQRFRGNSSRNSGPHFPRNDPVEHHRIERPQGGNRYVQAVSPSENALVEQLRTELRVSQNQIEALIKRNSELAGIPAPNFMNRLAGRPLLLRLACNHALYRRGTFQPKPRPYHVTWEIYYISHQRANSGSQFRYLSYVLCPLIL